MNNKQKAGLLKYLSDFFRTFGGAAIFIGLNAIIFNRQEAIDSPAATAVLIVTGFFSMLIGLYFVYVAEHFNDIE